MVLLLFFNMLDKRLSNYSLYRSNPNVFLWPIGASGLYIFKWLGISKEEEYFNVREIAVKFKFHCPQLQCCGHSAMLICLGIVCGCLQATNAEDSEQQLSQSRYRTNSLQLSPSKLCQKAPRISTVCVFMTSWTTGYASWVANKWQGSLCVLTTQKMSPGAATSWPTLLRGN